MEGWDEEQERGHLSLVADPLQNIAFDSGQDGIPVGIRGFGRGYDAVGLADADIRDYVSDADRRVVAHPLNGCRRDGKLAREPPERVLQRVASDDLSADRGDVLPRKHLFGADRCEGTL
jgi:hypothetical protein